MAKLGRKRKLVDRIREQQYPNPQFQILLRPEDVEKLPKNRDIADKITQRCLEGFTPTINKQEPCIRKQIRLTRPILEHLENLSGRTGVSVCAIVREMLGFDY